MGDVRITGAGPDLLAGDITLQVKGEDVGVSIAISVSQDSASMAVWRFQVVAQGDEGDRVVGEFTTRPPAAGDPASRVVAFASCPGAKDWHVLAFGPRPTIVG